MTKTTCDFCDKPVGTSSQIVLWSGWRDRLFGADCCIGCRDALVAELKARTKSRAASPANA